MAANVTAASGDLAAVERKLADTTAALDKTTLLLARVAADLRQPAQGRSGDGRCGGASSGYSRGSGTDDESRRRPSRRPDSGHVFFGGAGWLFADLMVA